MKTKFRDTKLGKGSSEFKQFIMRGNIIDMAVGVIIGGAFGKIVSSLVNDLIMPLVGVLLGGLNFATLSWTIKGTSIPYGLLIQNIVDFVIIAISIFVFIKIVSKFSTKKEKEEKQQKDNSVVLLEEIRDLLKEKKK